MFSFSSIFPIGTTSGTGNLQDQYNLRGERSRSFQDMRHRLVFSYIYELPFGRGRTFLNGASSNVNRLVGGWQINGITFYQSGRAFTIASAFDHSSTGSSNIRPDATGISPDLPSNGRSPQRFINAAAFATPAGFAFGNTGRNVGTGPSQTNFDFSVFKEVALDGEGRRKVQVRGEFFNVLNTPQFQIPNRTFNTPQFGTITETINDNRDVQLAVRIIWQESRTRRERLSLEEHGQEHPEKTILEEIDDGFVQVVSAPDRRFSRIPMS